MRALVLVPLLALAACDTLAVYPPEGGVSADGYSLTADRDAYDRGDPVDLTLRNDGSETGSMGVLGCAVLERRTDAGWSDDLGYNDRACIAMALYVEPGDEVEGTLELDGVRAGTYRFVHDVSGVAVATGSFVVG